ncbi:uncharacterized protein LOC133782292 [Humulus lupulus]|uniref:uncharacterized protein LOC133782292 n=1 Tax=Humulus lupulus TaxID=3486 RepID=UPI002B416261|nr:uncharacterized protein LOC133782292 [Humulus lupulus]
MEADFKISIGAKNKQAFINGSLPQSARNDPLLSSWLRCNQMVMLWILHSVSPDIETSIMFFDTAAATWSELNIRFDQGNGPCLFELRETFIALHQDNDLNIQQSQGTVHKQNGRIRQKPSFLKDYICDLT